MYEGKKGRILRKQRKLWKSEIICNSAFHLATLKFAHSGYEKQELKWTRLTFPSHANAKHA